MTSASEEPEDTVLFASLQKLHQQQLQMLHLMELVQVLLVQLKLLPLDPIAVESPQLLLLLAVKWVMETIWKLSVFKMVLDPPLQQELQPPSLESVEYYGMPLLPLIRPPMPQPAPMPLHSKLESILTMMRPLLLLQLVLHLHWLTLTIVKTVQLP